MANSQPFYHGTRVAIHETDKPFLDPARSVRPDGTIKKDVNDPEIPHVFIADTKLASQLFALQTDAKQHICGSHEGGRFPHAIYTTRPSFDPDATGYVYTFTPGQIKQDIKPCDPGKFAIFQTQPVSAAQCETVRLADLARGDDPVRIFYYDPKTNLGEFAKPHGEAARAGVDAHVAFLTRALEEGKIHYVDIGIKNDPWLGAREAVAARPGPARPQARPV